MIKKKGFEQWLIYLDGMFGKLVVVFISQISECQRQINILADTYSTNESSVVE